MSQFKLSPVYVAVMSAVLLTACGGGGGGGGVRPDQQTDNGSGTTPPPPVNTVNASRITISGGADVLVAVVDSGARVSHSEFQGGVLSSTYNVLDGSTNVTDNDPQGHGTAMASIVAGVTKGYSGNAKLMIVKTTEGGTVSTVNHAAGFAYAANNNARVISDSSDTWRTNTLALAPSYQTAVTKNVVWSAAAGNGGNDLSNITGSQLFWDAATADDIALRNNLVIVGRLNAAGTDRDSTSDYPGARTVIQGRYVLAPGTGIAAADSTSDSGFKNVSGTSPATAVVSALASSIISKWPHLSATQTADLILSTATRTNSLYSQNNCGPTGTGNCGDFFMGRGVMNATAALAPVGVLSISTDGQVGSQATPVAMSNLNTSRAFGDAFSTLSPLSAVHAFDDLGRNYAVDMRPTSLHATRSVINRTGGMGAFVQKTSAASSRFAYTAGKDNLTGWLRYDENGAPASAAIRLQSGDASLTGYRLSLGETNPVAGAEGLEGLRMLSYNGSSDVANDYRTISGVSGAVSMSKDVSVGFDSWYSAESALGYKDVGASRAEVSVRYQPTDWLRVSAGMASLTEKNAMLGVRGDGALGFRSGAAFVSQTLGLDLIPVAGASLFARYEQGSMGTVRGNLLIDKVTDIRASQFALGATYGNEFVQAALVASAPLRVDSARAEFNTPVGRTMDGAVINARQTANLAPSGREHNVELALATRAGKTGTVQFNVARTLNPGHDAAAKPVDSAAVSYNVKF